MARQAGNRKTGTKENGNSEEHHQTSGQRLGQANTQGSGWEVSAQEEGNSALVLFTPQDSGSRPSTAGFSALENTPVSSTHSPQNPTPPSRLVANATQHVLDTLGVTNTGHGLYQMSGDVSSQELFCGLLAHLLQAHGGFFSTTYPDQFSEAVEEFRMANLAALARTGERLAGQQNQGMDLMKQEQGDAIEENASRAIERILDVLSLTLSMYYKYRLLPTPSVGDPGNPMVTLDSAFVAGSQSPGGDPPTSAVEPTAPSNAVQVPTASNAVQVPTAPNAVQVPTASNGVQWTAETYYSNPLPQSLREQILRYANHPAFQYPVNPALNWQFRGIEFCRGSILTPTGWIPPTSCPRYRQYLATELYRALNEWTSAGLDDGGTRVFKAWQSLHRGSPEEFWRVAWRIVAKIHKLHMHAEEVRNMNFLTRVEYVRDLFRRAKGSCFLAWKEGVLKVYISDPVGKKKTFGYNQSSNARKKQRDADHAGLHAQVHGEDPPWKMAKKRTTNGGKTTEASGGTNTTSNAMMEPQQTQPLLLSRSAAAERDARVEAPSGGADAEGDPAGATATRKRKRNAATASKSKGKGKAKANTADEEDEEPKGDPKQSKKIRSTPASGNTTHRNIAPRPAPIQHLTSPNVQLNLPLMMQPGSEPDPQALNRFRSLSTNANTVNLPMSSPVPPQVNNNVTASNINGQGRYSLNAMGFMPFRHAQQPNVPYVPYVEHGQAGPSNYGQSDNVPYVEHGQAGPSNYGQTDNVTQSISPFNPMVPFPFTTVRLQEEDGLAGLLEENRAPQGRLMGPPSLLGTSQGYPMQQANVMETDERPLNFLTQPYTPNVFNSTQVPTIVPPSPATMQRVLANSQLNTAQRYDEGFRADPPQYWVPSMWGNLLPQELRTVEQNALDAMESYTSTSMLDQLEGINENRLDVDDFMEQYAAGMEFEDLMDEDGFQY